MNFKRNLQISIKTKITATTLIIFVISIWSLAFFVSQLLHKDMERMLSEKQFSAASFMAAAVDNDLNDRMHLLEKFSMQITPSLLRNPAALQTFMEQQPVLTILFNSGAFIVGTDGVAVANLPLSVKRVGVGYMERDFIIAALKEGKTTIGAPVIGKKLKAPIFVIGTPIRDTRGVIIGALAGVTDLSIRSFLDTISEESSRKNGSYYLLVSKPQLQVVTSNDKNRIMTKLVPIGTQPKRDRFLQGQDGSSLITNSLGVEVLCSFKKLSQADWVVVVASPTSAAFAPIQAMQRRMFLTASLLTLLAGVLIWWVVRRQLAPMLVATNALNTFPVKMQPLPVTSQDEIGQLVTGFNHLLAIREKQSVELRDEKQRQESIVRGTNAGTWEWNVQTGETVFNELWAGIIGYSLDEISPVSIETWTKFAHPDDLQNSGELLKKHFNGELEYYHCECRMKHKNGQWVWVLDRGRVASWNDAGKPLWMFGTHQDITDRKQMENVLRDSRMLLDSIINGTTDAVYVKDTNGRYLLFNAAAASAVGKSREDVLGKDDHCIFPHGEAITVMEGDRKVIEGGVVKTYEEMVTDVSGEIITYLSTKGPLFDANGEPIGLFGIARNITERKQAEEQIKESEDRFRSLMENVQNVAVQGYALDGSVLFWNRASECLYGYRAEEALESNLLDLIIPTEMREGVAGAMQQMIETGEPIPAGELLLKRKDGSRVPVFSSHALLTPIARQPELFCLDIDLTELKKMEKDLLQAKAIAESANTAKSQFLANMSHEIRTPMNGVLGMTQLLEMTELTHDQREYVDALKLSGKNLISLISDILDLSKIEAGKLDIVMADFSLHHSINDVILMQKTVAFEKHIALDLSLAKDIPPLLVGDQLRIKQILLNLLVNAIKFTAEGRVTLSTLLLEQHENFALIQIAVRDTGIGISPESLGNIFKPFTQEDGSISRKFGGTGLGLTISLRLAELMGGTISLESTQGVGSCFTVTLPFSVGRETATIRTDTPLPTIGWDGPPLRILFAEDDQVNIKFGASLLKKLGHDVTVVENGRECLTALEQSTFDLVLMDIQMPIMTGEEALREIRSKEQGTTNHQPIIALTAYSMRGDMERLLDQGFDGYVSKPLITRELIAEMKRVMGLSGEAMEETHG
ncbi:MAG: PAS domain S-box protein [Desulfuromonadales bacterium]